MSALMNQVSLMETSSKIEASSVSPREVFVAPKEENNDEQKRNRLAGNYCEKGCCCYACVAALIICLLCAVGLIIALVLTSKISVDTATDATINMGNWTTTTSTTATSTTTTSATTVTTSTATTSTTSDTSTTTSTSTASTTTTSVTTTTSNTATTSTTSVTTTTSITTTTTSDTSTTTSVTMTTTSATTTTGTSTTTTKPTCTTSATFDDITGQSSSSGVVPSGYKGLNWTNTVYVNVSSMPLSGYQVMLPPSPYVAHNPGGVNITIASTNGTSFSFDSIVLAGAWRDNLTWSIALFRSGSYRLGTSTRLNTKNSTLFACGSCTNVDTIVMSTGGGNPHPGLAQNGTEFVFDNLCISFGF